MDKKKIDNINIDVSHDEYPDYSNAFIVSADYDGEPMNDEQLEELNEDSDFIYSIIQKLL